MLFTTLSESSAGALAELFLGGVRILLSSLFDGFSSANDFRLGVEELRFSDFFSALAGFESELPLSFASAFPSQLLLKALGPDSKLNKVLLMELPREDFLPAVVAFNTDAAFSSKDSLDGGDFSAPLVLTLCFMSLENLSNDAGREWALVGEDGVDLALVDFAFELTTSFLSERRPLSACFERLEFDLRQGTGVLGTTIGGGGLGGLAAAKKKSGGAGHHKILRVADAGMAAWDRPDPPEDRHRGGRLETIDMDELPQLDDVAQDEVVLLVRQRHVGGVRRVGHLEVEPLVGEQVAPGERGHDADDLEQRRPVLARDLDVAVHVLQELEEDPGYQRRHRCSS